MRRNEVRSKRSQTNNKATHHIQGSHFFFTGQRSYVELLCAEGGAWERGYAATCTCTVHVLRCALLLCFVVCLTLLASFFLPSHLSLKHVHTVHVYIRSI